MATSNKPEPPRDPATLPQSREGGQAHYLRLLNEQLAGWDNPRAMLERALVPATIHTARDPRRGQPA